MEGAVLAARALARRHQEATEAEPVRSLLNYAESPRHDDWTLRSALVRFAQPEPVRAGAVLELVRRCDAALQPLARAIERHTVPCDRAPSWSALTEADPEHPVDAVAPYADGRIVDLARVAHQRPEDAETLVAAYREQVELDAEELDALPLLRTALHLDDLAAILVDWVPLAPDEAPVDDVDRLCAQVHRELDELGVPVEERPPGMRRGPARP